MTCEICLSPFTKDLRKEIACPYCSKCACLQCMKELLLQSPRDPHCFDCRKGLTPDFLDQTFTKGFRRGDLRKKQIEVLLDLEKSLLPQASEVLAQRKREIEYNRHSNALNVMVARMKSTLSPEPGLDDLLHMLRDLRSSVVTKKEAKHIRTVKCPNCRGFIEISRTGTCGLCSYTVCRSCGGQSQEHHVCNEVEKETFQYIKDNYKSCPKCGCHIEKVSGCNQMFCVSCHTAFDWSSLKITTGPIHNPHYFEFVRQGNLPQMQANACEEPFEHLYDAFPASLQAEAGRHPCQRCARTYTPCGPGCLYALHFFSIWAAVNWILADVRHPIPEYSETLYLEDRISYLQNKLSDEKWKARLSQHETLRIKKQRLYEIRRMFVTVARDLAMTLASTKEYATFCASMNQLREYVIAAEHQIYKDYSNVTFRFFDASWQSVMIQVLK